MYWLKIMAATIAAFFSAITPILQEANTITYLMGLVIFCTLFPLWLVAFITHKQKEEIPSSK